MVSGNIEKVQEFIKSIDINGHDSESNVKDTALIRATKAGKTLNSILFDIFVTLNMVL